MKKLKTFENFKINEINKSDESDEDLTKIENSIKELINSLYNKENIKNNLGTGEKIPKVLYFFSSFNVYFKKLFNSDGYRFYINYPTNIYDKTKHDKIITEANNLLKNKFNNVKLNKDVVGTSNAVIEYIVW